MVLPRYEKSIKDQAATGKCPSLIQKDPKPPLTANPLNLSRFNSATDFRLDAIHVFNMQPQMVHINQ